MAGPMDYKSTGNSDPSKAKEEIGRSQKAYQEYIKSAEDHAKAGRQDLADNARKLADNAHNYADDQRKLYTEKGGNAADVTDKDLTSLYKGGAAGAYDPSKAGQQAKPSAPTQAAAPSYSAPSSRPTMQTGMSFADALAQAKAKFDPLRQDSLRTLGTQYQTDRGNVDQAAAGRGVGHSGLAVNAITNLAAGNASAIAKANATYDSNAASMATDLQKDDRNFNFQKWMADNSNFNSDRSFGYQQSRDSVGDARYDDNTQYQRGRDQIGDQRYQQNWDRQGSQIDWQKQMQEAGMTGKWNGNWTQQARQAYAQMMGVDPVTGKPTFSREQFDTNTALRREQMAQQAALAQMRAAASQKPTSSPDSMYWALNASGVPSDQMGKVLLEMGVSPEQINGVTQYWKTAVQPVTSAQSNPSWDHWDTSGYTQTPQSAPNTGWDGFKNWLGF